jgi:hypothetical protein
MKQKTYHLAESILELIEDELIIDIEEDNWVRLKRKIEHYLDDYTQEVLDELEAKNDN